MTFQHFSENTVEQSERVESSNKMAQPNVEDQEYDASNFNKNDPTLYTQEIRDADNDSVNKSNDNLNYAYDADVASSPLNNQDKQHVIDKEQKCDSVNDAATSSSTPYVVSGNDIVQLELYRYNEAEKKVTKRTVEMVPISETPKLVFMRDFLVPEECSHLIEICKGRWIRSLTSKGKLNHPQEEYCTGSNSETRTSYSVTLDPGETPEVRIIEARLASIAKIPVENLEPLVVVRYYPGQFFGEHHDGQFRPSTILMYLNDVTDGGQTEFPSLGIRIKPCKGAALYWHNVDDNGDPDFRLTHAALPSPNQIKFVVNCFFNVDKFRQPLNQPKNYFPQMPSSVPESPAPVTYPQALAGSANIAKQYNQSTELQTVPVPEGVQTDGNLLAKLLNMSDVNRRDQIPQNYQQLPTHADPNQSVKQFDGALPRLIRNSTHYNSAMCVPRPNLITKQASFYDNFSLNQYAAATSVLQDKGQNSIFPAENTASRCQVSNPDMQKLCVSNPTQYSPIFGHNFFNQPNASNYQGHNMNIKQAQMPYHSILPSDHILNANPATDGINWRATRLRNVSSNFGQSYGVEGRNSLLGQQAYFSSRLNTSSAILHDDMGNTLESSVLSNLARAPRESFPLSQKPRNSNGETTPVNSKMAPMFNNQLNNSRLIPAISEHSSFVVNKMHMHPMNHRDPNLRGMLMQHSQNDVHCKPQLHCIYPKIHPAIKCKSYSPPRGQMLNNNASFDPNFAHVSPLATRYRMPLRPRMAKRLKEPQFSFRPPNSYIRPIRSFECYQISNENNEQPLQHDSLFQK